MDILTAFTLKYLWLNKKRTAVTVFGVVLSSALICGVLLLGVSFQQVMLDRARGFTGNYHAEFAGVPMQQVKYIAENSAVEQAMVTIGLGIGTFGSQNSDKPYVYLFAYDAASFKNQPFKLVSGRLPQREGELVVSQAMSVGSGQALQPGSLVNVTFGQRVDGEGRLVDQFSGLDRGETFQPDRTAAYTVVGISEPLFDEYSLPSAYAGYTWLDPSRLGANDPVNVFILARQPIRIYSTAPQLVEAAGLPASTEISYNGELLTWLGVKPQEGFLRFFLTIIGVIIALVVAGSALVIFNAFSISIGERKKQFGMFASVGATSQQIRRTVLTEALVIAGVGIPLGILGAIIGIGITLKLTQGVVMQVMGIEQGMPLVVSPLALILTVLVSAGTILLSAWIPARRAARVSPIDAIRMSAEIQETRPSRLRTHPLIRKCFGFEGELALKSLKRDRKRYRTTVLSLMISIILFVAFNALMMYSTLSARIDNESVNYDLMVWLDAENAKEAAFVDQAVRLPEVGAYSYVRCADARFLAAPSQLTGQAQQVLQEVGALVYSPEGMVPIQTRVCALGTAEFERYTRKLGLDPQQKTGSDRPAVLINGQNLHQGKLYAFDYLNLMTGDRMSVTANPMSESDRPAEVAFTLAAVTGETPLGINQPSSNLILIVPDAVLDEVRPILNPVGEMTTLYITSSDPSGLTTAIKKLYQETVGDSPNYYSMAEYNQRSNLTELMVNLFFYGFLTLITLVGVTNIINTLDTNIKLRRREIAMLKSVGLTPGGFLRMLRYESLFYGLTALLWGLPIGIALSVLIYSQFGGVSYFGFRLPWGAILACVAGILVIVFATMMVSGAMIRNDNIVETIKEENL